MALPSPFPRSVLTSYFGDRRNRPAPHSGTDWAAPTGTPIRASGNGRIHFNGWHNNRTGYVTTVVYGNYYVMYCHNQRPGPLPVGRSVKYGDVIGYVGATGSAVGAHVHVEVYLNGSVIDPARLFDYNRYVSVTPAGGDTKPVPKPEPRKDTKMTTLYFVKGHNNTRARGKDGWALAGDAGDPTSPANWIETTDPAFGGALEKKHGPRVEVGPGGWDSFRRDYRAGGSSSNVNVEVDSAGIARAIAEAIKGQITVDPQAIARATADVLASRLED